MSSPDRIAIVRTVADLRRAVAAWRRAGETVGFVPTMGALHAGHIALVHAAGAECPRTVASIFVNPKQFGPHEDFASYPRNEAEDARLLGAAGADLLYAPHVAEIYPQGFATTVAVADITDVLEGAHRPGHFRGVATVVAKLLAQTMPDKAYFGEKDYQQLLVVRRLARDLDLPVEIRGVPTVREADGLALSSRNVYLTAAERAIAPALHRTLGEVAARLADGSAPVAPEIARASQALLAAGFAEVDYLAVCDAETLAPLDLVRRPARVLAAAGLGRTRLIDNIAV